MPYVTSWERFGMERGLQQGLQQGLEQGLERGLEQGEQRATARLVLRLIERRFGPVDQALRARIEDPDTLLLWHDRLLDAGSLDEIFGH